MTKLDWCLQQRNGIKLVEPNENLSKAYFADANDSLLAAGRNIGKWKVVTGYYACYHALYALLIKTGIRSEIHDCTLALIHLFPFSSDEIKFIEKLKADRIDSQYYLKTVPEPSEAHVRLFVTRCKTLAEALDADSITRIRGLVKNG